MLGHRAGWQGCPGSPPAVHGWNQAGLQGESGSRKEKLHRPLPAKTLWPWLKVFSVDVELHKVHAAAAEEWILLPRGHMGSGAVFVAKDAFIDILIPFSRRGDRHGNRCIQVRDLAGISIV